MLTVLTATQNIKPDEGEKGNNNSGLVTNGIDIKMPNPKNPHAMGFLFSLYPKYE